MDEIDQNKIDVVQILKEVFYQDSDFRECVDSVLRILLNHLNLPAAELWLINYENTEIGLFSQCFQSPNSLEFQKYSKGITRFQKGQGLPGSAWESRQPIIWGSLQSNANFVRREAALKAGFHSGAAIPISRHNAVVGVMVFFSQQKEESLIQHRAFFQSMDGILGLELRRKLLEDQMSQIFRNSPDILCIAGSKGKFVKVNPAFSKLMGYTEEELISTPFEFFLHPEDTVKTLQEYSTSNETKTPTVNFVNRYITKTGAIRWISWSSALVSDSSDYSFAYGKDITEEKKMHFALEETAEVAQIGGWDYDIVEDAFTLSLRARKILDLTSDETLTLESAIRTYTPESQAEVRANVKRCMTTGEPWDFELPIRISDGTLRWIRNIGRSEFLRGKCIRLYGSIQNIHSRKTIEQEVLQANRDLHARTVELTESNSELEQFAYIASHDLQEPLRMISSFLTQLEKKYNHLLDDRGRQYIFFAVDAAKRMRQIILDLLDYSRAGQKNNSPTTFSISELVDDVCILLNCKIEQTQATITKEELPTILSYKPLLMQIFQNLIDNSLKYAKKSVPPVIKIGSYKDGERWVFSVQDNGIGIGESYFEKIFVIFQRLHPKGEYEGTGMGLAVCKKITNRLGGHLWIESTLGEGSTFFFSIPEGAP